MLAALLAPLAPAFLLLLAPVRTTAPARGAFSLRVKRCAELVRRLDFDARKLVRRRRALEVP